MESLTGFAVGKRDTHLLKQSVSASVYLASITAIGFTLGFGFFGEMIVELLVVEESARETAIAWLPWVIAAPLIGIWSFLLDGIFIGATQTCSMRNGMLVSLLCFMVCASVLVPIWGNHGIWIAYFVLLIARTVTLGLKWHLVLLATKQGKS